MKRIYISVMLSIIFFSVSNSQTISGTITDAITKEVLIGAINDVANKQRQAIADWEAQHPDWTKTDTGKDEYIKLVKSVMADISSEQMCDWQRLPEFLRPSRHRLDQELIVRPLPLYKTVTQSLQETRQLGFQLLPDVVDHFSQH